MYLKDDYIVVTLDTKCEILSQCSTKPSYVLDPDALSGWLDGPGTKRNNTVRPVSWGDFSEPGYKSARMISVTGSALANTPAELQELRDRLISVYSDGKFAEMSVATSTGTRFAYVGIEGTPRWAHQTDTTASFKIDLYAPDPRIYGQEESVSLTDSSPSGGLDLPLNYPINYNGDIVPKSVSMYNNGNVDAWPKVVVTGDYYLGFEITNGNSKKVRYEGMVTRSAPVTIDLGAGTAVQNGVDKSNLLTRRDWFSIPANSSIEPRFYPIQKAAGWCDIMYRDTWI